MAFESLASNKLRTLLTSLGIVFGVASVIAMLAIGKGAENEILERMKLLGADNIIIEKVVPEPKSAAEKEENPQKEQERFSPGLSVADANIIASIPGIAFTAPEIVIQTTALSGLTQRSVNVIGVSEYYLTAGGFSVAQGSWFNSTHFATNAPVCVIGEGMRTKLFPNSDPIGKKIKCGEQWLTVLGVFAERTLTIANIEQLNLRDFNTDIVIPLPTMLVRFKNRAFVSVTQIQQQSRSRRGGGNNAQTTLSDEELNELRNYHQIDKIIVRVQDTRSMSMLAELITRRLLRRHNGVNDFTVVVPEMLLAQEKRTRDIFNIVLGSIASISLLVGGIGIMNIMLAGVMERIREIGTRRALGATRGDIVMQFLGEAVAISISGGVLGVALGIGFSYAIERFADIITAVSVSSVALSFGVAMAVGLLFGIVPARKAALQNPVESLRYE